MRYFGRSQKEQFDEYKGELEAIEQKVFMGHYREMVELLELALCCYPYDRDMPGGRDSREDPKNMRNVQGKIQKLTQSLDAEVKSEIAKHFLKLNSS